MATATKMKISFDLFETVEQNEHIQEVHFTKNNQHYFNKHELDGKSYGFLKTKQVHSHSVGDRKFFKMQSVPNPAAEILETLTRNQILAMDPVDESEIFQTVRAKKKASKSPKEKEEAASA